MGHIMIIVMPGILRGTLILDWLRTMMVGGIVPGRSVDDTIIWRSMSMGWTMVLCKVSVSSSLTWTVVGILMTMIMVVVRILKKRIQA